MQGMSIVKTTSLEAKKAYFAKPRRPNYTASLRLEGSSVQRADASRDLPTKDQPLSQGESLSLGKYGVRQDPYCYPGTMQSPEHS